MQGEVESIHPSLKATKMNMVTDLLREFRADTFVTSGY